MQTFSFFSLVFLGRFPAAQTIYDVEEKDVLLLGISFPCFVNSLDEKTDVG